jgi:hypothetical protein
MARIISPVTDPEKIRNKGERIVFKAFQKALGNHFLVFYSVPFIREHKKGGNLVDGENDFILLDQQRGTLLVLEVKEGVIKCGTAGDRPVYFQDDRPMDISPWAQASGNKYSLVDWLSAKIGCDSHKFPLSHGHAVLLPEVHTPVGSPMPDITTDTALTWGSDEDLAAKMDACSEAWLMKGLRKSLGP